MQNLNNFFSRFTSGIGICCATVVCWNSGLDETFKKKIEQIHTVDNYLIDLDGSYENVEDTFERKTSSTSDELNTLFELFVSKTWENWHQTNENYELK